MFIKISVYLAILLSIFFVKNAKAEIDKGTADTILNYGKVALTWNTRINKYRQSQNLPLLNTSTINKKSKKHPPSSPYEFSSSTILSRFKRNQDKTPISLLAYFDGKLELTNFIPPEIEENSFAVLLKEYRSIYEEYNRWNRIQNYHSYYKKKASQDIRYYQELNKTRNLEGHLLNWYNLSENIKQNLQKNLIGLCLHSNSSINSCKYLFEESLMASGSALGFYNQFYYLGEYWWKQLLNITYQRKNKNITISYSNKTINAKLLSTKNSNIDNWIKTNLENYFNLKNWQLIIATTNNEKEASFEVKFIEGVVPGTLSNYTIQLDSLESIDDPLTIWTLQHEFGHVLGFTDCYLEFIDPLDPLNVIYYEVDYKNFMCSRKGEFLEFHLDQILKSYE